MSTSTIMSALTAEQQAAVETYKAYNVPATWFFAEPAEDGTVEVLALGDGFVWSFTIAPDGECHTSEAEVGDFSFGIEV